MTPTPGLWDFILNWPGVLGAGFGSMAIENEPAGMSDSRETWRQLRELTAASVLRHRLTPQTPEHAAALEIEEDLDASIWRRLSRPARRRARERPDAIRGRDAS
jgi:hypothetical protein